MEEKVRKVVFVPREILLIELERLCSKSQCKAKTRFSLTKEEAGNYKGFNCSICGRWNKDWLTFFDVPEWWEEIRQK